MWPLLEAPCLLHRSPPPNFLSERGTRFPCVYRILQLSANWLACLFFCFPLSFEHHEDKTMPNLFTTIEPRTQHTA